MSMRSLIVGVVLFTACAADVGEGRVEATVTDAPAQTTGEGTAAAPVAAGNKLAVDVAQSKVGLIGAKVTAQHPISFTEFTGDVTMDAGTVTGVHFVAQVSSIVSDDERLTEHLKGEDFLHMEQFPTGEFTSTAIVAGAEGEGWTHTVTGNLTIRGVTKQVSFPANIAITDDKVTAKSEFVINRQDFGVTYPGRADNLVQDSVAMNIEFVAPRS